jgi:hypothetical protein
MLVCVCVCVCVCVIIMQGDDREFGKLMMDPMTSMAKEWQQHGSAQGRLFFEENLKENIYIYIYIRIPFKDV